MPVDDLVRRALEMEIEKLSMGQSFHIVEFSREGVVIWGVHRDRNGTPCAEHYPPLRVEPSDEKVRDDPRIRRLSDHARVIYVRSSPREPAEHVLNLLRFRGIDADLNIHDCLTSLEGLLRDSIKYSRLTHFYELVLLRKTKSGRLYFEPVQLFAPDERCPARKTITIRCPQSDERGTAFAIVTTERAKGFELMSLQSAALSPGAYRLTAELIRPGLVRFEGLPPSARLHDDHRTWGDLLDLVPPALVTPDPAHLVCLIEVSGTSEQISRRVDRVRELVRVAAASDGRLKVSLVTYGAHSFERKVTEDAAKELAWAASAGEVLAVLDDLEHYRPLAGAYRDAAQLECALALIRPRVIAEDGRPVLLVVGSRQPFPARHDPRVDALPCPYRVDWRQQLAELSRVHGELTIGAIYDRDTQNVTIWRELGRTEVSTLDVVDTYQFAAALRIGGAPVCVPFPLVAPDES